MKILFAVHQFFPKHYTGTERLTLNISKQMQRMGHSVKVLTYGITETEGFKQDGNFLIKKYEFQGIPVISIRHKIDDDDISFKIFDPSMEEIIRKIIDDEKIDIIHVTHPMRVGSVIKAAKDKEIPVVLNLTDFWLMCPRAIAVTEYGELCYSNENGKRCIRDCYANVPEDKLVKRINDSKEVFEKVDCFFSATYFLKWMFETNNYKSNIKHIKFGTDYSNVKSNLREYSKDSEIDIGFLSTLSPHKGAHILLDAFNKVKTRNIKLKIYGHHLGNTDYYELLIQKAMNEDRVEFCGEYTYEEMPDIFSQIDILIIPSIWWENSPLILLGALAHNVPVIVSNLGGMTEIIKDEENGFIFTVGDINSLARILQQVGENPNILNKIKTNINYPPMIEEEAFEYEKIYKMLKNS